jgi:hypothetical protein
MVWSARANERTRATRFDEHLIKAAEPSDHFNAVATSRRTEPHAAPL